MVSKTATATHCPSCAALRVVLVWGWHHLELVHPLPLPLLQWIQKGHLPAPRHCFYDPGGGDPHWLATHTQQPSQPAWLPRPKAKPHTSARRHITLFQEVPNTRDNEIMGGEPTHLLGVLQRAAAHPRPQPLLTEVASNMWLLLVWGWHCPIQGWCTGRTTRTKELWHPYNCNTLPLMQCSASATGVGVAPAFRGVVHWSYHTDAGTLAPIQLQHTTPHAVLCVCYWCGGGTAPYRGGALAVPHRRRNFGTHTTAKQASHTLLCLCYWCGGGTAPYGWVYLTGSVAPIQLPSKHPAHCSPSATGVGVALL